MGIFKNKWSNWKDLSIGKIHEYVYLLQFRRHENGKVEFRTAKSEPAWGIDTPNINDLTPTKSV